MAEDKGSSARESSIASGWTVEGSSLESDARAVAPQAAEALGEGVDVQSQDAPQLSNGALVLLGLVGGVYLLFTWVWLSWAQHYSTLAEIRVGGVWSIDLALQQLLIWLAPLAPAAWFVSALALNRGKTRSLVLWVLIGLLVVVPLPMFFDAAMPTLSADFFGGAE